MSYTVGTCVLYDANKNRIEVAAFLDVYSALIQMGQEK